MNKVNTGQVEPVVIPHNKILLEEEYLQLIILADAGYEPAILELSKRAT